MYCMQQVLISGFYAHKNILPRYWSITRTGLDIYIDVHGHCLDANGKEKAFFPNPGKTFTLSFSA